MPGTSFFTWSRPHVADFLGSRVEEICFIPFAAVKFSFDHYEEIVTQVFAEIGYRVQSIHRAADKKKYLRDASCIMVGGGNTFALLSRLYEDDMLNAIRDKVAAGTPYVGWSAGANLACPTLKTTNDMPVVMPPSFEALRLVPFQINPHYHELRFENQGGETRRERLEEFMVLNPTSKVIGLPEGMFIRVEGDSCKVGGEGTAKLYVNNQSIRDLRPGEEISSLVGPGLDSAGRE